MAATLKPWHVTRVGNSRAHEQQETRSSICVSYTRAQRSDVIYCVDFVCMAGRLPTHTVMWHNQRNCIEITKRSQRYMLSHIFLQPCFYLELSRRSGRGVCIQPDWLKSQSLPQTRRRWVALNTEAAELTGRERHDFKDSNRGRRFEIWKASGDELRQTRTRISNDALGQFCLQTISFSPAATAAHFSSCARPLYLFHTKKKHPKLIYPFHSGHFGSLCLC